MGNAKSLGRQLPLMSITMIMAGIAVELDPESSDRCYSFEDSTTQRSFEIRRCLRLNDQGRKQHQFFMSEWVPTGRLCVCDAHGKVVSSRTEPLVKQLETQVGPNLLMRELATRGIHRDQLGLASGGLGVDTIYHDSLEHCAEAIHEVLKENVRYRHYRELTAQQKTKMAREDAKQSHAYWGEQQQHAERSFLNEAGIFKGCHNAMGRALDGDTKRGILCYLNAPSQSGWLEIRNRLIAGSTTLWQAWVAIDSAAPRSGDEGYPGAEQVRQMIPAAVAARQVYVTAKRGATNASGLRVISGHRR